MTAGGKGNVASSARPGTMLGRGRPTATSGEGSNGWTA